MSRTRGTRIASLMRVCGSGRRGGSQEPLRGLKLRSPSSCQPPRRSTKQSMKTPLACSGAVSSTCSVEPPKLALGGERRFRPCLPGLKVSNLSPELRKAERGLLAAVLADRQAVVALLVAEDDEERDPLDLAVADPLADGLVGLVDLDPVRGELGCQLVRCGAVALADRQHADLDGGEPERE